MKQLSASQERYQLHAVELVATQLLFNRMRVLYPVRALRDVVIIHNGQGLKEAERDQSGPFDVFASGGLVGHHANRLTTEPFVVIGRRGSAGKPTFAPYGGWVIDTAYYAQPLDRIALDTKFLYYAICNLDFSGDVISTAIPGINRTAIYLHSIPIPPVHIQRQIIRFLDATADKSVLPELLEDLQLIRGTVARIEALAGRVEEARGLRREAAEEAEALFTSSLRHTFQARKFSCVPLEYVCTAIIDNLHSNPLYSENGTVPCIRSSDVGWGRLYLHTAGKTSEAEYSRRTIRGEPQPGDIVLVREGGGTGKAALVEKGNRFSLGQRVMMLRPNQALVLPKFLLFQLLSPQIYKEQILPLSKGSASPHLNIGALRRFEFILPTLVEQDQLVRYFDDVRAKTDGLEGLQSDTQKELDALMPSILARAFAGGL